MTNAFNDIIFFSCLFSLWNALLCSPCSIGVDDQGNDEELPIMPSSAPMFWSLISPLLPRTSLISSPRSTRCYLVVPPLNLQHNHPLKSSISGHALVDVRICTTPFTHEIIPTNFGNMNHSSVPLQAHNAFVSGATRPEATHELTHNQIVNLIGWHSSTISSA